MGCKFKMFETGVKWLLCLLVFAKLSGDEVQRTILGLYAANSESFYDKNAICRFAEMPLNHLGLKIVPHDLRQGMPPFEAIADLRGILLWLDEDFTAPYIDEMVDKMLQLSSQGVKIVVFGVFPNQQINTSYNKIFNLLGLNFRGDWSKRNFNSVYDKNEPLFLDFEKTIQGYLSTYMILEPSDQEVQPLLSVNHANFKGLSSVLASLHPRGGMVQRGFSVLEQDGGEESKLYWMINPFRYFAESFNTQSDPKPDTTTLAGRRLFYSHLDGDGWYNVSLIPKYYKDAKICAEVIYQEICLQYPDLPMTVGMIGAEIDSNWSGKANGIEAAKKIYALPHVEIGTHTFTHPFVWDFFKHYNQEKEAPFFSLYPNGSFGQSKSHAFIEHFFSVVHPQNPNSYLIDGEGSTEQNNGLSKGHQIPRFYAKEPFNLELEIYGALKVVEEVAPPGKKCMIYQWSGDAYPFEKAIHFTRLANVGNLNGGDSRFDNKFLSYAWVAPIGRAVGAERQIYSSNSNENTYTKLWHDDFFGFQELKQTFINTESPLRIKPMNIYYHTYSGERLSSLNALHANFDYVRKQAICPIPCSHFAKIAEGFYTTEFEKIEPLIWKVKNRGALQTIRLDHAVLQGVDFAKSKGAIGQRHFHGSLYVYLDESQKEPLIALKEIAEFDSEPHEKELYLIESRWRVFNLHGMAFDATGFGPGEMVWNVPQEGVYKIEFQGHEIEVESQNGKLCFELPPIASQNAVHVYIKAPQGT